MRSVLQPQVAGLAELKPVRVHAGDDLAIDDLVEQLAAAAYTRVDLVERRGEFAVRGGIVDVFPPTEEHPLRLDFWGDTVDEIQWFKVADQRSLETAEHGLWAPPCRELLLTDDVRSRARALAERHPELADLFDKIAAGIAVEGMESLAPVLVEDMELLLDLLPTGTHVLVCDPERVHTRAHDLVATSQEFLEASWAAAAGGGRAPIDLGAAAYRSLADVRAHAIGLGLPWWGVSPYGGDDELLDSADGGVASRVVSARPADSYRGDTQRAVADLKGWLADRLRVVVVTGGHGTAERVGEVLADADVPNRLVDRIETAPDPGVVHVSTGALAHGFVADTAAAGRPHRGRHHRAAGLHQRHAAVAQPATKPGRPAAATPR